MHDQNAWNVKYSKLSAREDYIRIVNSVEPLKIAKILTELISSPSLILECGSGTGRIVNYLSMAIGTSGYGVDYSSEANRVARGGALTLGLHCSFVCGDLARLPFQGNLFDVVFSDSVIEHLPDPERAVQEMARVTRPGGWVVVTTPNKLRPDGWDLYKYLYNPPYLQRSFTPWDLKFLFERAGLKAQRFFGDTLFLLRNFHKSKRAINQKDKQFLNNKPSKGLYLKLEGLLGPFVPSYLWVNLGVIGRKELQLDPKAGP